MAAAPEQRIVDGVPVFSVPGPPGPTSAGMVFRVGQADETLATRGRTHLVEHLALHGAEDLVMACNGSVDLLMTDLTVRDEPAKVAAHFRRAIDQLRALPGARLEAELRVLRTESYRRSGGPLSVLHDARYGTRGHGLVGRRELGLHDVTIAQAQAWADERFTAGNAALWVIGDVPDDLDLSGLADGPRWPLPEVATVPGLSLPGWVPYDDRGVRFTAVTDRGPASMLLMQYLREVLTDRLRDELGLSYEVSTQSQRLDGGRVSHVVAADASPDQTERVRGEMLATLHGLQMRGPSREVMDRLLASWRADIADPFVLLGAAPSAAGAHLLGDPFESAEDVLAQVSALEPRDLWPVLDQLLASSLWAVRSDVGMDHRYPLVPQWSTTRVHGNEVAPPATAERPDRTLVVGQEGISLLVGEERDRYVTVAWDRCDAVLVWDDDTRSVMGSDGFVVVVVASDWQDVLEVLGVIDHLTAAAPRVVMGGPWNVDAAPAPAPLSPWSTTGLPEA